MDNQGTKQMIKWKDTDLIPNFTIIHSNKIKKMNNGYFEIVEYDNNIKVYVRENGDFRLDNGKLPNIEQAKQFCQDYLKFILGDN